MAKLLILTKNTLLCRRLEEALCREWEVYFVSEPAPVEEILAEHDFSAILLDSVLTGCEGIPLLKVLHKHPQTVRVPLLILLHNANPKLEETFRSAGVREFIQASDLSGASERLNQLISNRTQGSKTNLPSESPDQETELSKEETAPKDHFKFFWISLLQF